LDLGVLMMQREVATPDKEIKEAHAKDRGEGEL
jgi:hypothetical protein